jgi:hypothetical protein
LHVCKSVLPIVNSSSAFHFIIVASGERSSWRSSEVTGSLIVQFIGYRYTQVSLGHGGVLFAFSELIGKSRICWHTGENGEVNFETWGMLC